jgi:hypothetical protein
MAGDALGELVDRHRRRGHRGRVLSGGTGGGRGTERRESGRPREESNAPTRRPLGNGAFASFSKVTPRWMAGLNGPPSNGRKAHLTFGPGCMYSYWLLLNHAPTFFI